MNKCPIHKALGVLGEITPFINAPTDFYTALPYNYGEKDIQRIVDAIRSIDRESIKPGATIRYIVSKEDPTRNDNPYQLSDVGWEVLLCVLKDTHVTFVRNDPYCDILDAPGKDETWILAIRALDRILSVAIEYSHNEDEYKKNFAAAKKLTIQLAMIPNNIESRVMSLITGDSELGYFEKLKERLKTQTYNYGICPAVGDGTISKIFMAMEMKFRECYPLGTVLSIHQERELAKESITGRMLSKFSGLIHNAFNRLNPHW